MCNLFFYSLRYELSKYISIYIVACLEQKLYIRKDASQRTQPSNMDSLDFFYKQPYHVT